MPNIIVILIKDDPSMPRLGADAFIKTPLKLSMMPAMGLSRYRPFHFRGTELNGYITGERNIQNCIKNGLAKIKSLLKVPRADTPKPTENARMAVIMTKGNTHNINQLNFMPNQNIIAKRTMKDIKKSKSATMTAESGNTSRDAELFFIIAAF
jgi:hypothetical protein